MSGLMVTGLRRSFGSTVALDGVDLEIAQGTLTAVLGPSGCGKTTLLRLVAGFLRPDDGALRIGETTVASSGTAFVRPERRRVGYVPQEGALFPHQSVGDNIGFGLPRRERKAGDRVSELLRIVGLDEGFAGRRPDELSGGQQQRVALARALAPRPSLVLLDEPFASLDARLREDTGRAVAKILSDNGATGLLVTHDQGEALSLADRIAVMESGRILQEGPPREIYAMPAGRAVAELVGASVVLPATVSDGDVVTVFGRSPLSAPRPDGRCTALVRPEHLAICEGGVPGTVIAARFHGHTADVEIEVEGQNVLVRTPGSAVPALGDVVNVAVEGPVHAFDVER